MEITNTIGGAYELIDASGVDEEIKEKCRIILRKLVSDAEVEKDKLDPYILCRGALIQLSDLLRGFVDEHAQLFEGLKVVILKARDSVKGWKTR